jgi:hypothetical protein
MMTEPYTTTETFNSYREFLHNNFGWHGDANGYYVPGIFDTSDDYTEELPSNTRSVEEGNFQYNLRVWTNIYH